MNSNESTIKKQSQKLHQHTEELKKAFNLPQSITPCVASKYANTSQIEALYNEGFRLFGENKIQDGLEKINFCSHLPDIQWHFIGHLQKNKVKKAVENFDVIQSVDSIELLERIHTISSQLNKTTPCYIQINIANDVNKFGFSKEKFLESQAKLFSFSNAPINGIMIIVPLEENKEKTKQMFMDSYNLFKSISQLPDNSQLSMGMSQDYPLAIECGSTMIRIGRMLFQEQGV